MDHLGIFLELLQWFPLSKAGYAFKVVNEASESLKVIIVLLYNSAHKKPSQYAFFFDSHIINPYIYIMITIVMCLTCSINFIIFKLFVKFKLLT